MGVMFFKDCSAAKLLEIKILAVFVGQTCTSLVDLLTFLEGSKYPTSHVLYDKLGDLETKLSVWSEGSLPEEVTVLLTKQSTLKRAETTEHIKRTVKLSLCKLRDLMLKDPAGKVFKGINLLLSPRHLARAPLNQDSLKKIQSTVPLLREISLMHLQESHEVFRKCVVEEMATSVTVDVLPILCSLKEDHLEFANLAIKALWMPTNNVDSERSFSQYSIVVSDRRRRLKPENAETLTMLAFQTD